MSRRILVELNEEGVVTLKRQGYSDAQDAYSETIYVPDFAGAITKEPYMNSLAARELYEAVTNIVDFVLGGKLGFRSYWESFEVEVLDGKISDEDSSEAKNHTDSESPHVTRTHDR